MKKYLSLFDILNRVLTKYQQKGNYYRRNLAVVLIVTCLPIAVIGIINYIATKKFAKLG